LHRVAVLVVALVASSAWLAVGSATAAPRWSKPTTVAKTYCRGGYPTKLQAAENARGDMLVAWVEEGCTELDDGRWRVIAISRKAGHRFGRLRSIHSGRTPLAVQLGVALDERGGGTIAWTRTPMYNSVPTAFPDTAVLVSTRLAGGRFSRPKLVDEHGGSFDLSANAAGETVLTWVHFAPPNDYYRRGPVVAAIRPAGETRFEAAQTLSGPPPDIASPSAAIAPGGTALVTWAHNDGSADYCCAALEASVRPAGRPFGPIQVIAPREAELSLGHAVTLDSSGRGVVAWTTFQTVRYPEPPRRPLGVFASRFDGQSFSAPVTLERGMDAVGSPQVFIARDGQATVEWNHGFPPGGNSTCDVSSRYALALPASGSPGQPSTITPAGSGLQPTFVSAQDSRGRLVRAWFEGTSVSSNKIGDCFFKAGRVRASIDGGPVIEVPAFKRAAEITLLGAPAAKPVLLLSLIGRVLISRLRESR
jgi:hypothetical protein